MWNTTLTAVFTPTSYGTVTTIVGSDESGEFSSATQASAGDNGVGTESTDGVEVDLRELELRVARAQAELDAARLREAQAETEAQVATSR